jgi:hypothetical protein
MLERPRSDAARSALPLVFPPKAPDGLVLGCVVGRDWLGAGRAEGVPVFGRVLGWPP